MPPGPAQQHPELRLTGGLFRQWPLTVVGRARQRGRAGHRARLAHLLDRGVGPLPNRRDVQPVRMASRVRRNGVGATAKQGHRTSSIAPSGMGHPDSKLGQAPPQLPLAAGAGFPNVLEYLVGMEGQPRCEQPLCFTQRLGRGTQEIRGRNLDTGRTVRQRASESIARAAVASRARRPQGAFAARVIGLD
jgi:hypothetical protein